VLSIYIVVNSTETPDESKGLQRSSRAFPDKTCWKSSLLKSLFKKENKLTERWLRYSSFQLLSAQYKLCFSVLNYTWREAIEFVHE